MTRQEIANTAAAALRTITHIRTVEGATESEYVFIDAIERAMLAVRDGDLDLDTCWSHFDNSLGFVRSLKRNRAVDTLTHELRTGEYGVSEAQEDAARAIWARAKQDVMMAGYGAPAPVDELVDEVEANEDQHDLQRMTFEAEAFAKNVTQDTVNELYLVNTESDGVLVDLVFRGITKYGQKFQVRVEYNSDDYSPAVFSYQILQDEDWSVENIFS